ncbi:MAG TPA: hypothetical protein VGR78_17230, partial [Verrucomicrobiae bacterium]|nr:hypothetical protein [Verrucomicrobiae bacterium]
IPNSLSCSVALAPVDKRGAKGYFRNPNVFLKFLVPPLWTGGFGLGALAAWLTGDPIAKGAFPTAWLAGSAFILWFSKRLRKFSIDEQFLYVSDYRFEIRVPLNDILYWRYQMWWRPSLATIYLRTSSRAGPRVVFAPINDLRWNFWRPPSVLLELESLVKKGK